MIIMAIVYRGTLGVKSAINQALGFKNILQKPIFQQCTGLRAWKGNFRMICCSIQRHISISRFSKTVTKAEIDTEKMTAVINNVIMYKYEKGVAFIIIIAFAFIQLFGMISMAYNVYNTFCQDLWNPKKPWRERLVEHTFSLFAIISGCFFGPLIFLAIMIITSRTIRRIILHKGGDKVTFVTYHLIPRKAIQTIPVDKIDCKASRKNVGTVPLSIEGKRFYYFVHTEGEFLNADLFDHTIGLCRR